MEDLLCAIDSINTRLYCLKPSAAWYASAWTLVRGHSIASWQKAQEGEHSQLMEAEVKSVYLYCISTTQIY